MQRLALCTTLLHVFRSVSEVGHFPSRNINYSSKLQIFRRFAMGDASTSAASGSGTRPTSSPARKNSGGHNRVHDRSKCIFCSIVDGTDPKSGKDKIIFQNDELAVFPDIRPAAKYHFLVVTKEHIKDSKSLIGSQINLLDRMVEVGNQVLTDAIAADSPGTSLPKVLMGFHWPPFHTVSHLHLHVIAPSDSMGIVGRIIFRPNSYWFVQPEWVRERLQKLSPSSGQPS